MRWSQTFIPTMKEVPADAEIPSHQLMLRAGLIRQVMAGAYTYLPLGWRAVRKVEAIVREEQVKREVNLADEQGCEVVDESLGAAAGKAKRQRIEEAIPPSADTTSR